MATRKVRFLFRRATSGIRRSLHVSDTRIWYVSLLLIYVYRHGGIYLYILQINVYGITQDDNICRLSPARLILPNATTKNNSLAVIGDGIKLAWAYFLE